MDLPAQPLPAIQADPFLLRRAVNNLLTNCVRHNAPGCPISVGARAEGGAVLLWVESGGAAAPSSGPGEPSQLEPDGGAAHGTGLKLVAQIAEAHGGRARFSRGSRFRCELRLPADGRSLS